MRRVPPESCAVSAMLRTRGSRAHSGICSPLFTRMGDGAARHSSAAGDVKESSNPGPTLDALDAFHFTKHVNREQILDKAVEFLLDHWVTRKPLGPCHYGIGRLFMQVEYPLRRYNLLNYVYVLSFYDRARSDSRFRQALDVLESKMRRGKVVVENPHRKLADLSLCTKQVPSDAATAHYRKILQNIAGP